MTKKVAIFNFSPRVNGNCTEIAKVISNYYNQGQVKSYQFTVDNCSPCNHCDYECIKPGSKCPHIPGYIEDALDAAGSCDVIYYIIPNFCGNPNANYYAFLERCTGYFGFNREMRAAFLKIKKGFIVVSNTENQSFQQAVQQQTAAEPKILYMKTGKYQKRSTAGDLMESAEARSDLEAFLASMGEDKADSI